MLRCLDRRRLDKMSSELADGRQSETRSKSRQRLLTLVAEIATAVVLLGRNLGMESTPSEIGSMTFVLE